MWTATNADDCLARAWCRPIGGSSVWSTFSNNLASNDGKGTIVVSSHWDSTAILHDFAFGAGQRTSLITALVIADALSKVGAQGLVLTQCSHLPHLRVYQNTFFSPSLQRNRMDFWDRSDLSRISQLPFNAILNQTHLHQRALFPMLHVPVRVWRRQISHVSILTRLKQLLIWTPWVIFGNLVLLNNIIFTQIRSMPKTRTWYQSCLETSLFQDGMDCLT